MQQGSNAASDPSAVGVAVLDADTKHWHYLPGRYDPATHSVSAQVTTLNSWVAAVTFDFKAVGNALRQTLSSLLAVRTTPPPCAGVDGVTVTSEPKDSPIQACAAQPDADHLAVTITNTRGYALVLPTPDGVTASPPEYTDYTGFFERDQTRHRGWTASTSLQVRAVPT
jgi:hypothetical protein